jgi:hypothetical protein
MVVLCRRHYILLVFLAVYVTANVLCLRIDFQTQAALQQGLIDRIVLYTACITGSLLWTMFALVLQPGNIESYIIAHNARACR